MYLLGLPCVVFFFSRGTTRLVRSLAFCSHAANINCGKAHTPHLCLHVGVLEIYAAYISLTLQICAIVVECNHRCVVVVVLVVPCHRRQMSANECDEK